jgi:hypothetical protein
LKSLPFANSDDSVEYDNNSKLCVFFNGPYFSTVDAGSEAFDWLHFIDPPAQPAAHNITHMCSTDCPAAHGQKYVSEFGEVLSSSPSFILSLCVYEKAYLTSCFFLYPALPHGMRQKTRNSAL